MIINLQEQLISMVEGDRRFKSWAKQITSVDTSKANGYAFEGDFVNSGTVEIDESAKLYLVHTEAGSRKNRVANYNVVKFENGEFTLLDINDSTYGERGWAIRIRDQVASALAELQDTPSPDFSDLVALAELQDTVEINSERLLQLLSLAKLV